MNQRYENAVAALQEMDRLSRTGLHMTEASAIGALQAQAPLAVAEEQAKTNQHLELANLIAYAQLCKMSRDGHAAMKAMKAVQTAMGLPDDEDDL